MSISSISRLYVPRYLSLQASCPLGVDAITRCEVEQRICVEGAAPRNDCLEPVLHKAWGYLRYVCLPLFLSSQVTRVMNLMKDLKSWELVYFVKFAVKWGICVVIAT